MDGKVGDGGHSDGPSVSGVTPPAAPRAPKNPKRLESPFFPLHEPDARLVELPTGGDRNASDGPVARTYTPSDVG